ncbi:hypothetical protein [Parapedobacter tibetensis]|uniref:hypothetical protein n=1 Tax=Parapedobacter tibetensis TaxID=2972951 RepID=UPI00214DB38A|nr:hypothetical protein [Parapedobacter tibetensis]
MSTLNQRIRSLLEQIGQKQSVMIDRLDTREMLQNALKPMAGMPPQAWQMYANDQLAFYQDLVADMMAFFTGNDQGRCVAFALTVEELLFMIRLLLDEHIMDTRALKPIFLFLSRYASTSGSATLSYESLRKKYSRTGPAAHSKVRDTLLNMIGRIDQYPDDGHT